MVNAPTSDPGLLELAIVLLATLFVLGILVFILYLLYDAQRAIPVEHRRMEPGQVWLLLIPLFNLGWNFVVFQRIPDSYQSYFYSRGRYDVGDAGRSIGLWYSICAACSFIPCIGFIPALIGLILLIVFLVRIYGMKGQLEQLAAMPEVAPQTYGVPGAFPVGYGPAGISPAPFPPAGHQPPRPPPPPPPAQG